MKKVFLSIVLTSALFANYASCNKVLGKLDEKIEKLSQQKKSNKAKLERLKSQKAEVKEHCANGKINTNTLQQIKSKHGHNKKQEKHNAKNKHQSKSGKDKQLNKKRVKKSNITQE